MNSKKMGPERRMKPGGRERGAERGLGTGAELEERERERRRHMIRVIIAEAGMVCAVIMVVLVAMLASMGFFVNSDGGIEQSGLAQIHSVPTGASVELDGTTLFSRTNLSRTMPAGEHTLKMSRANYDTWEKTIKMRSGVLLRLYYPRLFLVNRTAEKAGAFATDLEFYSPSGDRTSIIYAKKASAEWSLVNIENDEVKTTALDLATVLPGVKEGVFEGKIEKLEWSKNGDYILVKVSYTGKAEWIVVNLKDVKRSLNLTQTFGLAFSQVEMIDEAANRLYVLENQHVRQVNTVDKTISQVLLSEVEGFASEGANLMYVQKATREVEEGGSGGGSEGAGGGSEGAGGGSEKDKGKVTKAVKVVGTYRDGEKGGVELTEVAAEAKVKVALAKYYDEDYMAVFVNDGLTIYHGAIPGYREGAGANPEVENLQTLLAGESFAVAPTRFEVSPGDDYLLAAKDKHYMVIGLDAGEIYEYEVETAATQWLDTSMLSGVVGGVLKVWDYDYTNRRDLVASRGAGEELAAVTTRSEAEVLGYPAVITSNNKWLYYVVRGEGENVLMRERVRE